MCFLPSVQMCFRERIYLWNLSCAIICYLIPYVIFITLCHFYLKGWILSLMRLGAFQIQLKRRHILFNYLFLLREVRGGGRSYLYLLIIFLSLDSFGRVPFQFKSSAVESEENIQGKKGEFNAIQFYTIQNLKNTILFD